eukprot:UC1_evm1s98
MVFRVVQRVQALPLVVLLFLRLSHLPCISATVGPTANATTSREAAATTTTSGQHGVVRNRRRMIVPPLECRVLYLEDGNVAPGTIKECSGCVLPWARPSQQSFDQGEHNFWKCFVPVLIERRFNRVILTGVRLKTLPAEIGNATSLQSLDVTDNELTRLPTELFNLPELRILTLNGNKLETLPEAIGKLTGLITLDVGNNLLQSLPANFSKLVNLVYLKMDNNRLLSSGSLDALSGLPDTNLMRFLDISGNNMLGRIPRWSNLKFLVNFKARNNRFTGAIDSDFWETVAASSLIILDLSFNRITDAGSKRNYSSPRLDTRLTRLELSHNLISRFVLYGSDMPHIQTLSLDHNHLANVPYGIMHGTKSGIKHLDISYNRIERVNHWIKDIAARNPNMVLSMAGNPSVCTRTLMEKVLSYMSILDKPPLNVQVSCVCASGYYGIDECKRNWELAPQQQTYVSGFGLLTVRYPYMATPNFQDFQAQKLRIATLSQMQCGPILRSNVNVNLISVRAPKRFSGSHTFKIEYENCNEGPVGKNDKTGIIWEDVARSIAVSQSAFKYEPNGRRNNEYFYLKRMPLVFVGSGFNARGLFSDDREVIVHTMEWGVDFTLDISKKSLGLPAEVRPNPHVTEANITFAILLSSVSSNIRSCQRYNMESAVSNGANYDGSGSEILFRAQRPAPRCLFDLKATEHATQEELHVATIDVRARDCLGEYSLNRCGNYGYCVDAVPFDGKFTCECQTGWTGARCNLESFSVSWTRSWVASGPLVLDTRVNLDAPSYTNIVRGGAMLENDAIHYSATDLPFGMRLNPKTGVLSGRPLETGYYEPTIIATLLADSSVVTRVTSSQLLALNITECENSASCGGGKCVYGANLYDGNFTCDCQGTGMVGERCETKYIPPLSVVWNMTALGRAVAGQPFFWPGPENVTLLPAVLFERSDGGDELKLGSGGGGGGGGVDNDYYSLRYSASGLPCGIVLNASSGALSGSAGQSGSFDAVKIFAQTIGQTAFVNQESFALEVVDCDNVLTCNGGTCIDNVPYDGEFDCQCATGRTGAFCELSVTESPVQAASNGNGDNLDESSVVIVAASAASGSVLLVLVVILFAYYRSRRERAFDFSEAIERLKEAQLMASSSLANQSSELRRPIEIKRGHIVLGRELGAGQFGQVVSATVGAGYLGEQASVALAACNSSNSNSNSSDGNDSGGNGSVSGIKGRPVTVAVKMVRVGDQQDRDAIAAQLDLLEEAALMANLNHPNVMSLLGVCTVGSPKMVLLPMCAHGALDEFLERMDRALSLGVRLGICRDAACGMEYLAKAKIVHRDLAARNVLVDGSFRCRISDFGMAREIDGSDYYTSRRTQAVPLRWMAPEALDKARFTEASDIWAFGVLCWEVFSGAALPYGNWTADRVFMEIQAGQRLQCPASCPRQVYTDILLSCWAAEADNRPNFAHLNKRLNDLQIPLNGNGDAGFRNRLSQSLHDAAKMDDNFLLTAASPVTIPEGDGHNPNPNPNPYMYQKLAPAGSTTSEHIMYQQYGEPNEALHLFNQAYTTTSLGENRTIYNSTTAHSAASTYDIPAGSSSESWTYIPRSKDNQASTDRFTYEISTSVSGVDDGGGVGVGGRGEGLRGSGNEVSVARPIYLPKRDSFLDKYGDVNIQKLNFDADEEHTANAEWSVSETSLGPEYLLDNLNLGNAPEDAAESVIAGEHAC